MVRTTEGTSKISNAYYISDNIYTPTYQSKASLASLNDATFQKNLLGDAFNVDEMISLGYYPQLKFSSNKMPNQDYIELPVVNEEYYADIVFMEVMHIFQYYFPSYRKARPCLCQSQNRSRILFLYCYSRRT